MPPKNIYHPDRPSVYLTRLQLATLHRKFDEREPDECWPWISSTTDRGYGFVRVQAGPNGTPTNIRAPRLMFDLFCRPLRANEIIRHTCDSPECVNPRHLVPGTHADNARDKVERGRQRNGEDINTSKLSPEDVLEILRKCTDGAPQSVVARHYGVSSASVWAIVNGKSWSHVTGIQRKAAA